DLLDLGRNPRMLSFIADLDAERLHTVATARHCRARRRPATRWCGSIPGFPGRGRLAERISQHHRHIPKI
ncbi:hypothetical protein, partial [Nonomuraea dietziae]|uniref:hypothetical protein n=1 Tax=Nonomuraea dietziae TaxID=65515 RepID=UPI003322ADA1